MELILIVVYDGRGEIVLVDYEYADGKSLQWEMGWGRGCAQGGGRCGIFLK